MAGLRRIMGSGREHSRGLRVHRPKSAVLLALLAASAMAAWKLAAPAGFSLQPTTPSFMRRSSLRRHAAAPDKNDDFDFDELGLKGSSGTALEDKPRKDRDSEEPEEMAPPEAHPSSEPVSGKGYCLRCGYTYEPEKGAPQKR